MHSILVSSFVRPQTTPGLGEARIGLSNEVRPRLFYFVGGSAVDRFCAWDQQPKLRCRTDDTRDDPASLPSCLQDESHLLMMDLVVAFVLVVFMLVLLCCCVASGSQ